MRRLARGWRSRGFTLLELSVVVLVITLLLGGLLVPLATQVDQRHVAETKARLKQIDEALIGYAIANGRFPCPASTTSEGLEDPTSGIGVCTHPFDGFVPGKTLGLSNLDEKGYVVDAWGLQQNRIRYAITDAGFGSVTNAFTVVGGMRAAGIPSLGTAPPTYLYVCASSTGITSSACSGIASTLPDPNALSRGDAVYVLFSLGKNAATGGGTSPDELANLDGDRVFVSKTDSAQAGVEFDDLMLWQSRYGVIGRLTAAAQLP